MTNFPTIDVADLDTITGGGNRPPGAPGPISKGAYTLLVAGTIALGKPAGQRHDDPSAGPLHRPAPITTSQAR